MQRCDFMQGRESLIGFLCRIFVFFFKQKTAYELRISDWSSDVCSSDLLYGYLRTLDRRGLLDWEEHRVGNRPPRKIYSPSEAGWETLRAWLRLPVYRLREVRLDLLLKLHLVGQIGRASCRERVCQCV